MENQEKSIIEKKHDEKKKLKRTNIILIVVGIIIILIDQISKIVVTNIGNISVIEGILELSATQNIEAAYGIGSNSTVMYVITNVIILGVIFKFLTTQNEFVDTKMKVFLSFILAGGTSNVIDRLIHGYVIEWIKISKLPVFNIADIFVLIGWVLVAAIFAGFTVNEFRKRRKN